MDDQPKAEEVCKFIQTLCKVKKGEELESSRQYHFRWDITDNNALLINVNQLRTIKRNNEMIEK